MTAVTTSQQPPAPTTFTMEELTALTGVTARTVRYYIAEGLLPPPEGAGPATAYTPIHRNRLLLIGAMKDAYLPLKEIRRRLATMRDDEIAAAVASHDEAMPLYSAPNDAAWKVPASDDASAYIDRILGPRTRHPARHSLPPSAPLPEAPSHREPASPAPAFKSPDFGAQSWKRLPITPEAELVIEEETFRRRQPQIEAALDWLRRILNGS